MPVATEQEQQEVEQLKREFEDCVKIKTTKQQLFDSFFLFAIVVLGLTVKDFHAEWINFRNSRKRSLILAPRDHGKSFLMTIAWVLWRIVKNPNLKIIIVGKAANVAEAFLDAIKSHITLNQTFRSIFGDIRGRMWRDNAIIVSTRTLYGHKEPTITAVGVYGTIVSGHYDIVICEDLADFENSRTKTQRDKLWDWFMTIVYPTVETDEEDPSKDGEMHFLGTRYHYDDMYGRLIGEVEQFKPGMLRNDFLLYSALQGSDKEGWYALWPERKNVKRLIQIKQDVGSIIFALQYENNADKTKGRIFQPGDFMNYWKLLPKDTIKLAGYDLAVSEKTTAHYFAEAIIHMDKKKNVYLEKVTQLRMSAPKQYEYIKSSHAQYKWIKGGIESVAYQKALPQWLQENTNVPAKAIPRHTDKTMRAYKVQPIFEAGKFFIKEGYRCPDFIDQMLQQPGEPDDMFDAIETAISLGYEGSSFDFFFLDG